MAGISNPSDLARTIEGPTLPPVSKPARQRDTREYKTAEQLTVGDVKHLMLPENSALIAVPGVSEILDAHTDDAAQGREVLQKICLRIANMQQGVAHEIEKRVVRGERYPLAVDVDKCDDEGYPIAKEKFVKAKELASGGMGEVWVGSMQEVKEPVAAKFLTTQNKTQVARFHREILLQSKLGGEDSPKLLGVAMDQNPPYFVMEYRPGHDLRQLLSERDENSWPAPEVPLIISLRLANIHGKLRAHRDLKPANIWISDKGEVWILDYGLASAEGSGPDLTESGVAAGTVAYMSPEQVWGMKRLTGESDVYSLACIMYEMYTGKKVHPDELTDRIAVPKEYCPDLSSIQKRDPALAELFVRMFDAEPHRRPSAAEVSEFFFERSSKRETSKDWKEFSKKKEQHRLSTASVAYAPDNIPVPSSVQPKGKYQSISVQVDDGDSPPVPQLSLKTSSPSMLAKLSRSVIARAFAGVAAVGGAVGGVYYMAKEVKDPQKAEAPFVPTPEVPDASDQGTENVKPVETSANQAQSIGVKPLEQNPEQSVPSVLHVTYQESGELKELTLFPDKQNPFILRGENGYTVSAKGKPEFELVYENPKDKADIIGVPLESLPEWMRKGKPAIFKYPSQPDGIHFFLATDVGVFLKDKSGKTLFFSGPNTGAEKVNDDVVYSDKKGFSTPLGKVSLGGTFTQFLRHPDVKEFLMGFDDASLDTAETVGENDPLRTEFYNGAEVNAAEVARGNVQMWKRMLLKAEETAQGKTNKSAQRSPAPAPDVQRAVQETGAVASQK